MRPSHVIKILSGTILTTTFLSSCTSNENGSKLKDLTNQQEDQPGSAVRMVWQDPEATGQYIFARCPADKEVIRESCTPVRAIPRDEVLQGLRQAQEQDLQDLRKELSSTISAAFRGHPLFKSILARIESLQSAIRTDQATIDTLVTVDKQGKQELLKTIEARKADQEQQLQKLDDLLAVNPNQPGLIRQKEQRLAELELTEIERSEVLAEIEALDQRISQLEKSIARHEALVLKQDDLLVQTANQGQVFNLDIEAIKGKVKAIERIGQSFEPLLDLIDGTPGYSYRLYDLEGDLLPVGAYLFSSKGLWSQDLNLTFSSLEGLSPLTGSWTVKAEEGIQFLAVTPDAKYSPSLNITAELPALTLTSGSTVSVSLRHRFETENSLDFGIVEYLSPIGEWVPATPIFTGTQYDWKDDSFTFSPLPELNELKLRLRFQADGSVEGRGWDIDSLKVEIQ